MTGPLGIKSSRGAGACYTAASPGVAVCPVPPKALSDLFRILRAGLRCVVLNACYTDEQATAIAAHVPCVVGMRCQVLDDTAVLFSAGFYRGIANGRSIRASFDLACNGLDMHGVPDRDVPRLIASSGDAEQPVIEPE